MNTFNSNNNLAEYIPPLIKNAVLEMQHNTKFPQSLIVSSALGAISAACQNSIDVQQPVGSPSPVSLFMLLIADSGEGKTPVDRFFTKPIIDHERNEAQEAEEALIQQKADRSIWAIELGEIETAIRRNRKKALSADQPEQVDLFKREFENLKQKLQDHVSKEPKEPRKYKLFYSNTVPTKMASDLAECWPSAGLFSDEAGCIFGGGAMKDLGMLNQLWDATPLTVDRMSSPSFIVKDARLTISLMAQGKIFDDYLTRRGKGARDIGFLARFLVAFPMSTKGSRFLDNQPQSWNNLTAFQQRITDILTQDKQEVAEGRQSRPILEFSQKAKEDWIYFRNAIEWDLNPGGYLSDIDDFASKISNNLARMAALFHFFEGKEGDISSETLSHAATICEWYIHEFKRLFTENSAVPIEVSDANDLGQCLVRWCQNHPGSMGIQKSYIAQYGPSQLRKDKVRREHALDTLVFQNQIQIQRYEKKLWVIFNPNFFPVPRDFEARFSIPLYRNRQLNQAH